MTTLSDAAIEARRQAGRPRDPACDAAILRATLEAFEAGGYPGVSIEGVAARAGVAKATVYRRFASKADLVVEAVRSGAHIEDHLPDTGDLRADLVEMMRTLLGYLRGKHGGLLVRFYAERVSNPDLAEAFDRSVVGKKREHMRHLLQSARQRGDLAADADIELIAEAGPAYIWHHAVYNLPFDDDLPERIVDLVLPSIR
ncbi:MAG: TetR/AcrR family transcriptional regulator [Actinobacteria bacterium]|nr:TetR/AcrR family transcriptional regulator [Actinomycetota bacterium]